VRDLPEEARKRIELSLGVPLCTTDYDADGKEIKRTIHNEAITKMAAVMSQINSTMFFHPPYVPGNLEWDYATEFDTIDPGIARGRMTYQFSAWDLYHAYVVGSGEFTAEKYPLSDELTEKNLRYVVSSQHIYNTRCGAWESATATVNFAYDLEQNGTPGATAKGTMTWELKSLPSSK